MLFSVGAAANRVGGRSGFTTDFSKSSQIVVAIARIVVAMLESDGANATFIAFVERLCAALGGRGEWQQSKEKNGKHGEKVK